MCASVCVCACVILDEEGSERDLLKHTHMQACYANACVSLHNNNAV